MKKALAVLLYIMVTPIVLVLVLVLSLYIPPVQDFAVKYATHYASKELGIDVDIKKLRLAFPVDLSLIDVVVKDKDGSHILDVNNVIVDLNFTQVFNGVIGIDEFTINDGYIDTKSIIENFTLRGQIGSVSVAASNAVDINRNRCAIETVAFRNCDFHVEIYDLVQETDTTSATMPWTIVVNQLTADALHISANMIDSISVEGFVNNIKANDILADLQKGAFALNSITSTIDYIRFNSYFLPYSTLEANNATYNSEKIVLQNACVCVSNSSMRIMIDADTESIDPNTLQEDKRFNISTDVVVDNDDVTLLCRYFGIDAFCKYAKQPLMASAYIHGNINDVHVDTLNINWPNVLGDILATANYNNISKSYDADININSLRPRCLHNDIPVILLSGLTHIEGNGFDLLDKATKFNIKSNFYKCVVDSLGNVKTTLMANLKSGEANAVIDIDSHFLKTSINFDALLSPKVLASTMSVDLINADLYQMNIVDSILSVAGCFHVDMTSDLSNKHRVTGHLNDILLITQDTILRPVDLDVDVLMQPDSLYAHFRAGQMVINATSPNGAGKLLQKTFAFIEQLNNQITETHYIEQDKLKPYIPETNVEMHILGRNPISTYLSLMGYTFDKLDLNLKTNPTNGLNGYGELTSLKFGEVLLDTIQFIAFQDTTGVQMDLRFRNSPKNKAYVFDAKLHTFLMSDGVGCNFSFVDGDGVCGANIGAMAKMTEQGVVLNITPKKPILAYRSFVLNDDNYLMLTKKANVLSNIKFLADDGTSLLVYSDTQQSDSAAVEQLYGGDQDITISLANINLGEVSRTLPYIIGFNGYANGDIHLIKQDSLMTAAVDANIKQFVVDDAAIGDIAVNCVYFPQSEKSHLVDGTLAINKHESILFNGIYTDEEGDGKLDIEVNLTQFPMSIVNGFVDHRLATVTGTTSGLIHINGNLESPIVNGLLTLDDIRILSSDYSLNLKVQNDTIKVYENYLDLNKIKVYSTGRNPLTLDGWVDCKDLDNLKTNIVIRASNFELINAKKTHKALAYGKVYCDINGRLYGTLQNITLNGSLKILGNTDVTYVLRDSPLTVEDRLKDLVTFVDFNAQEEDEIQEEISNLNISMTMALLIDDAAQVHCLLSDDKSSYIDIEGGGELVMAYGPKTDLQLTGTYMINSGEMKYQLPVIPLKTFKINSGSAVTFNGDILNPTLNLSAKERMKALVTTENGTSRSVPFDVGVKISKTLSDLGLQFTIDSPEDATTQNELDTKDEATRGRIALTMLATGMYLDDNNSSGFSADNALNSFLQGEISNIAGKALGSIDLTFNMDNNITASGAAQTDYSFQFAKHFFGNRVSVVLGGKVSSGQEAQNTGATIIDNVSLEYRLDKSATRYVRVFYDKAYESLMDGQLTEMGAGLLLRRKTTKLGDLFIFRKKE